MDNKSIWRMLAEKENRIAELEAENARLEAIIEMAREYFIDKPEKRDEVPHIWSAIDATE